MKVKINMNFVRKHIPKNGDEFCELTNNKLIPLEDRAYNFQDSQRLKWENYTFWTDASWEYQRDKKYSQPYQSIWKTQIWKEACHYIVALKMFEKKNLICEQCNKIIFERNGVCYCIIHHTTYTDADIFNEEKILVLHNDCHKKIHNTYIESYCEKCNKPTGTSWKTKCSECYSR